MYNLGYEASTLYSYKRHIATCPVDKSRIPRATRRNGHGLPLPDLDVWAHAAERASFPGKAPGSPTCKKAEAMRDALIAQSKSETVHGPKVSECIEKYLASRQHELGEKNIRPARNSAWPAQGFCERQGVVLARELNVDLLETFKRRDFPDIADTPSQQRLQSFAASCETPFAANGSRNRWWTE